jgi:CubicO group peptidase (beta-lactamase class C family)
MAHGFADERLEYIQPFLHGYVEAGTLPGYQLLVSRRDQEAHFLLDGLMDVERGAPFARDTIVRIYSMTKPIVSVALMQLYDRGAFQMDDPVSDYIPAWQQLRVFAGGDEHDHQTRPPDRPMIIKDLLTHTSGLTSGFMNAHPVDALYRANGLGGSRGDLSLEETVATLGRLPLQFSPGTRWQYGLSTDVVGYLVQVLADQPLDAYVAEHITGPLGMTDSGFVVPADKAARLAACYEASAVGAGMPAWRLQDDPATSNYLAPPAMLSGGGGMVATIGDYGRFTAMLLGKGEHDGVRVLGRKTAEYMTANHLPENQDLAAMGQPVFSETSFAGIGFGLGFSVVLDPAAANVVDSAGDFGWGGKAGTYFWVDPLEQVSVVFMAQLMDSDAQPLSAARVLRRHFAGPVHLRSRQPGANIGRRQLLLAGGGPVGTLRPAAG